MHLQSGASKVFLHEELARTQRLCYILFYLLVLLAVSVSSVSICELPLLLAMKVKVWQWVLVLSFFMFVLEIVLDFFGQTLTSVKVNEVDLTKCNNILIQIIFIRQKKHSFVTDSVLFLKWCCP